MINLLHKCCVLTSLRKQRDVPVNQMRSPFPEPMAIKTTKLQSNYERLFSQIKIISKLIFNNSSH